MQNLKRVSITWAELSSRQRVDDESPHSYDANSFVGDAEEALRMATPSAGELSDVHVSSSSVLLEEVDPGYIIRSMMIPVSELLMAGVGAWTADSRYASLK